MAIRYISQRLGDSADSAAIAESAVSTAAGVAATGSSTLTASDLFIVSVASGLAVHTIITIVTHFLKGK